MPSPILFSDTAHLPLGRPEPVKVPLGMPVAETRLLAQDAGQSLLTGVWECSPGRWRRQVLEREFSHIIAGHCRFIPDDGPALELRAGDAVLFPANCQGIWEVRETLRKSFVIIP